MKPKSLETSWLTLQQQSAPPSAPTRPSASSAQRRALARAGPLYTRTREMFGRRGPRLRMRMAAVSPGWTPRRPRSQAAEEGPTMDGWGRAANYSSRLPSTAMFKVASHDTFSFGHRHISATNLGLSSAKHLRGPCACVGAFRNR